MTNHPNRGWRGRWKLDVAAQEARHGPSGLVVRFSPAEDGAWDGEALNAAETADALMKVHGQASAAQMLARLMREAGDLWSERSE